MKNLTLSNSTVDKRLRLLNNMRMRIRALKLQRKFYCEKFNANDINLNIVDDDISALEMLVERLVIYSVVCNDTYRDVYREWKKFPESIEDHCMKVFNHYFRKRNTDFDRLNQLFRLKELGNNTKELENKIRDEEKRVKYLEDVKIMFRRNALSARKQELMFRLMVECKYRMKENWFVVFDTLTVDERSREKVFSKGSKVWTNYIRSIERSIGIRIYGSWREANSAKLDGNEFHTYFSVVERGTNTGRLHIHVLHFMKQLPPGCSDPNAGASTPYKREIAGIKKFWKYGYSTPIAVRFNDFDAYADLGWRWPVERVGDRFVSIDKNDSVAIACYMSKYINKEYGKPLREEFVSWRVRMTRKMGMIPLRMILDKMTEKELMMLMEIDQTKRLTMIGKYVPMSLLRREVLRTMIMKMSPKKFRNFLLLMKDYQPKESMFERYRNMTGTVRKFKMPNFTNTKMLIMRGTDDCDVIEKFQMEEYRIFGKIKSFGVTKGCSYARN